MTATLPVLKVHCPSCGQRIAVAVSDLHAQVVCPRCRVEHNIAELVGPEHTLEALPIPRAPAVARDVGAPTANANVDVWAIAAGSPGATPVSEAFLEPSVRELAKWREHAVALNGWLARYRGVLLGIVGLGVSSIAWLIVVVCGDNQTLANALLIGLAFSIPAVVFGTFAVQVVAHLQPDAPALGPAALKVVLAVGWSSIEGVQEAIEHFGAASPAERWRFGQRLCFGIAGGAILLQPFVTLARSLATATGLTGVGGVLELVGPSLVVIFLCLGFLVSMARARAVKAVARERGLSVEALAQSIGDPAIRTLPASIDMVWNRADAAKLATNLPPSVVRELLIALAEWKPKRYGDEYEYQASLYRHLVRAIPFAQPEREWNLGGRRGRVDLRIAGKINVELKRTMNDANADRLIGQLDKYLGGTPEREPTFVVVCEARPSFENSRIGEHVRRRRADGDPIMLIAAGTKERGWE